MASNIPLNEMYDDLKRADERGDSALANHISGKIKEHPDYKAVRLQRPEGVSDEELQKRIDERYMDVPRALAHGVARGVQGLVDIWNLAGQYGPTIGQRGEEGAAQVDVDIPGALESIIAKPQDTPASRLLGTAAELAPLGTAGRATRETGKVLGAEERIRKHKLTEEGIRFIEREGYPMRGGGTVNVSEHIQEQVVKNFDAGQSGVDAMWKSTVDILGDTAVIPRGPMQEATRSVSKYYKKGILPSPVREAIKNYMTVPSAKNAQELHNALNKNISKAAKKGMGTTEDAAMMEIKDALRKSLMQAGDAGSMEASLLKATIDNHHAFLKVFKDPKIVNNLVRGDPRTVDTVIRDVIAPGVDGKVSNIRALREALYHGDDAGKKAFRMVGRTFMSNRLDDIFRVAGEKVLVDSDAQIRVARQIVQLLGKQVGVDKMKLLFHGDDFKKMQALKQQMERVAAMKDPGRITRAFNKAFPPRSLRGRIIRTTAVYSGRGAAMGAGAAIIGATGAGVYFNASTGGR